MNSASQPLVKWIIHDKYQNKHAALLAAGRLFVVKSWVTVQKIKDEYLVMFVNGHDYYV